MKYLLLLLLASPVLADSWTDTRTTSYDWACMDAAGVVLSSHTREGTAKQACSNRALADGKEYIVQGGRYRITATRAAPTGSAVLSWSAPTRNTDGSTLTDLAGYRVYCGTSPTALTQCAQVNALTYTVQGLAPGTHYFTVAAYNSAGTESAMSGVASKVIP